MGGSIFQGGLRKFLGEYGKLHNHSIKNNYSKFTLNGSICNKK